MKKVTTRRASNVSKNKGMGVGLGIILTLDCGSSGVKNTKFREKRGRIIMRVRLSTLKTFDLLAY